MKEREKERKKERMKIWVNIVIIPERKKTKIYL